MATMASNTAATSPSGRDAGKASKDIADHYETLRNDVASLADTVKQLAGEQLGTTAGELQDAAVERINSLEATIRRNPTQSAMVAAGIGFLVGLVMLR